MEVGVITYDKGNSFLNCLYSLQRDGFDPIIVCTHPFNDIPSRLNNPNLRIIHLPENPGYGCAVNAILSEVHDHCLIVNDDIMIPKDQLSILQNEVEQASHPCIIQPKLDFGNGEIENYGHYLWIDAFNTARFRGQESSSIPVSNPTIFSGAAFVIHRDVIQKVGFFSEDLIFYGEEVDYALRMYQQNIFVRGSQATFIHGYGESLGEIYNEKIYLIERNRQKILQRLYPKTCTYNSFLGAMFRKKQFSSLDSTKMLPALLGILSGLRYGYRRQFQKSPLFRTKRSVSHYNRLTYSQLWNLFHKQNNI
jgi:GT2 family glycosyltransferase